MRAQYPRFRPRGQQAADGLSGHGLDYCTGRNSWGELLPGPPRNAGRPETVWSSARQSWGMEQEQSSPPQCHLSTRHSAQWVKARLSFTHNAAWRPELNYVYCTKKLKLSKTSPGIVQVWTAAKGSVDMVNAGSSVSSKQCPKKGFLLAGQDGWGLLCPPYPAGSQASARILLTGAAAPPHLTSPITAALGAPTTEQSRARGSQAREGPVGRR